MYVGIVYARDPPTKMKISNGEQAAFAKAISSTKLLTRATRGKAVQIRMKKSVAVSSGLELIFLNIIFSPF